MLADPDSAAERVQALGAAQCDPISSGLHAAYEAKTGLQSPPENAVPPSLTYQNPLGKPWEPDDLPQRFPSLCKRFASC